MQLKFYQKLLLSLLKIGLALWLGGSLVRAAVAYDIFKTDVELKLIEGLTERDALLNVRYFTAGALYTQIGFLIAFISSIILLPTAKSHFRKEGWLLMSYILFFLASISESILTYFDIKLATYVFFSNQLSFQSKEIQLFFFKRFKDYSFLFVYNWFAIITIIFLSIFRPLKRISDAKEENS
ncbi:MAG: hypothetical protein N2517_01850 [Ignavibacteria bacterium]|nr:hypothetical protein [Ignavibacteria bacterium]